MTVCGIDAQASRYSPLYSQARQDRAISEVVLFGVKLTSCEEKGRSQTPIEGGEQPEKKA
jgi:hypothetical protein